MQISERAILEHARVLSEDIGFRTVGTREHAAADAWMHRKALELKELCEETVRNEPGRKLECEVWRQVGSGNHRYEQQLFGYMNRLLMEYCQSFDILGTRLYKSYVNLTNIVVRVSDGTERGKEHAVLVNAHVDSTLPSPGAGDDALAVGVMLELARNLVHTKEWEPNWSIVFRSYILFHCGAWGLSLNDCQSSTTPKSPFKMAPTYSQRSTPYGRSERAYSHL